MTPPTLTELIAGDDLDGLLRRIDDLCDGGDWDGLAELRARCRTAFADFGRQLWPAAAHAEYRLALQAPGRWAAAVLVPDAGRFALGPLPEVAASTHAWEELAEHLPATPEAARFAQERVCRGEDLTGDLWAVAGAGGDPELPLRLEPWEPAYPVATFEPHKLTVPDVPEPRLHRCEAGLRRPPIDDPVSLDALADLVSVWRVQSEGQARSVAVEGDAVGALATLVGGDDVLMAPVDAGHAVALMAWTAASGGARGRRRGLAYGRFAAWWAVAALGGLDPSGWPHPPGEMTDALGDLRWHRWAPLDHPTTGWALRLAVELPDEGLAWAIEATDQL